MRAAVPPPVAAVREALLWARTPTGTTSQPVNGLSQRERQVASLIASGCTNRQIGAQLVITEGTVATHVVHILGKLGLSSRAQVAVWAAQRGLVDQSLANPAAGP